MTIRYCGPGGSDSNDGLSWANRKLTLTGVEDSPVAAGDICWIAPGVYRETLTLDVSGSSGNPITYIGDVTGANTDGIGGVVRVTGSDDDLVGTRITCITGASRSYRTFRGMTFGSSTGVVISISGASNDFILEDCCVLPPDGSSNCVSLAGTGTNNIVRRCVIMGGAQYGIALANGSTVNDTGHLIENCLLIGGGNGRGINVDRLGGITIKHCTIFGWDRGVSIGVSPAAGQTVNLYNSIIVSNQTGLFAAASGFLVEDYNCLNQNNSARSNVGTGTNSVSYPPLFALPTLIDNLNYPVPQFGTLSQWSALRRLAGTSMSSDDLYGITRPATDSKKSWGAIQYQDVSRDTTTKRTGAASLKIGDAGVHQMFVPTTNSSTTISVYVQYETDYAGTLPQLVVKQPGQSDQTDTATGSSGSWEELSVTLTPAASPGYCVVELVSHNEATSGSYGVYFDDLTVT